jgi:predicted MFS family arabinose efflux permease
MALVMAFRFGGRGAVTTFFNVYLDDGLGVSTSLIGALVASAQLLSVPAALAAPVLVARSGELRTITLGMLGMAFFVLPLALIPHWGAAGLGLVISTAFFSATSGPMQLYSQELVERRWQATMAAAFMMGPGLAFAATSLAGGIAIATVGYTSLFLLAAGLIALATLLFWVYFRVPRGELACRTASEIAG